MKKQAEMCKGWYYKTRTNEMRLKLTIPRVKKLPDDCKIINASSSGVRYGTISKKLGNVSKKELFEEIKISREDYYAISLEGESRWTCDEIQFSDGSVYGIDIFANDGDGKEYIKTEKL